MKKNPLLRTLIFTLVLGFFAFAPCFVSDVQAAKKKSKPTSVRAIPKDQRPSSTMPWVVGIVLSAGAVVVSLKPSKRTHLD